MRRALTPLLIATGLAALVGAGCDDDALDLSVDLKTDFVGGIEFTAVRTTLDAATTTDRGAFVGDSFASGHRIAELRGLTAGDHVVDVELRSASGMIVASRTVRVALRTSLALTVLITRSCRGVTCPRAGDSPTATECLGQRCVEPACSPERPELCGVAECTRDSDCRARAVCAPGACESGVCVFVPRPETCGPGLFCDPERGCMALPASLIDGGRPEVDGGVSPADAGPSDAGCASSAACDDGNPCNGAETCVPSGCTAGSPPICDDGVGCTIDTCAPPGGCTSTPSDSACTAALGGTCDRRTDCQYPTCTAVTCAPGPCEDATCMGSTCARSSRCSAGQICCGGACAAAGCDDGNTCTLDACSSTGCTHDPALGACDDGSTCTIADTCTGGVCVGAAVGCPDDGNPCTTETCGTSGCVSVFNSNSCASPEPCSLDAMCDAGACVSIMSRPDGTFCDDDDFCTMDDQCRRGICGGAQMFICVDAICDPATGACVAS